MAASSSGESCSKSSTSLTSTLGTGLCHSQHPGSHPLGLGAPQIPTSTALAPWCVLGRGEEGCNRSAHLEPPGDSGLPSSGDPVATGGMDPWLALNDSVLCSPTLPCPPIPTHLLVVNRPQALKTQPKVQILWSPPAIAL